MGQQVELGLPQWILLQVEPLWFEILWHGVQSSSEDSVPQDSGEQGPLNINNNQRTITVNDDIQNERNCSLAKDPKKKKKKIPVILKMTHESHTLLNVQL